MGEQPSISDDLLFPGSGDERWHVLHTKARHEKKVAEESGRMGLRAYLPLRKSVTRTRGRVHEFDVPLFAGYVFVCFAPEQRLELLRTNRIVNILEVADQQQLLNELSQIRNALAVEAPVEPFPFLKRGARVRVVSGPFQGLEGLVSRRQGKFRLVLNASFIHQSIALEIDAELVEPVESG